MLETKKLNPILMAQYNAMRELTEFEDNDNLKDLFSKFSNATCIKDAKEILKENFPQSQGKSAFSVNGAEIFVCIKQDLFRICADFSDEFVCYEFNK